MQYFTQLGFGRDPFPLAPEPDLFLPADQHALCLRRLESAVRQGQGLVAVAGRAGSGKTMLARRFARELAPGLDLLFLSDPDFSTPRVFLESLAGKLAVPCDASLPESGILERILAVFADPDQARPPLVLVMDDAQRLGADCLDILQRLLDRAPGEARLLRVVLLGRPELEAVLDSAPELRHRAGHLQELGPLSRAETNALIERRLRKAAPLGKPRSLFTWCAVRAIHNAAKGMPGRVVRLCRMALTDLAKESGSKSRRVGLRLVRRCVRLDGGYVPLGLFPIRPVCGPLLSVAALVVVAAGAGALVRYVPAASTVLTGLDRASASVQEETAVKVWGIPALEQAVRGDPPGSQPPARSGPSKPGPLDGLPEELGAIRLLPGETVADLVRDVYGAAGPALMRLVAEANPRLKDLGNVPAGTAVHFPARKSLAKTPPAAMHWVGLALSGDLEKAYAKLRQLRYFNLDCRILPSWSESDGLVFLVVLARPCPDRAAALRAMAQLPLSVQADAQPWNATLMGFVVLGALGPETGR